ncbi:MAG: hypothetical protein R3D02_04415 [Hyphomicrobiales bacterium]
MTIARWFGALALSAGTVFSGAALCRPRSREMGCVPAEAKGETVYWHAWAGESRINDYIAWVGAEVEKRLASSSSTPCSDTAEVVAAVRPKRPPRRERRFGRPQFDQWRELRLP